MKNIIQNIKSTFEKLTFDEDKHQYSVDSVKLKGSVSSKIDKFVEKVNFDEKAEIKAIRLGITKETLLSQWEEEKNIACNTGNRVHLFGELYPFNKTMKPSCPQELAITKFWNNLPSHIVPACLELRMYHLQFMFAGTSDILLFNTIDKTFIIADYKTNKDLFKNFKKKTLLAPFERLLDSPFNKYQIQLSFYQLLFEQTGYKVASRKIIWLLKTGDYLMYDCENLTKELLHELNKE